MIDLSKVKLPDCIEVAGSFFNIKTDFRAWLNFSRTVNIKGAVVDDVDFIYTDKIPPAENKKEAFEKLLDFFQPKAPLPRSTGESSGGKVLDYEIDADLIYAAFYEQYGIDLLATDEHDHAVYMHWHRFLALLSGLHNTKLNEVMSWRSWNGDAKTEYGKQMQKLRNAWELPEEKDEKVQEDLEKFNELFVKK
ncbi:MAG: bacteriophage Gp15 family protein [Treponema sp.]|nr:bacteriophage Gp15 family protein [Treponema sp.]